MNTTGYGIELTHTTLPKQLEQVEIHEEKRERNGPDQNPKCQACSDDFGKEISM
jgi:hypothetical protein